MMQRSMQAAIADSVGAAFRLTEVPVPEPGPGQILVRIHNSGVNPLDLKIKAGEAAHARQPLPAILGIDLAGTVERLGPGVTGFASGDAVWGMAGGVGGLQGSLAEFAAVDVRLVAHKPDRLSMREAATLPLAAVTAWEGLVERSEVAAGDRVLVIGAAGGVGQVVVQIAGARGATAYGIGPAKAADYLRSLGCVPIERGTPVEAYVGEMTGGAGFDVVYDCVGALDEAFLAVRRLGRVTSALGWGTHSLAPLSLRAARYAGVFTLAPLLTGEGREVHGNILAAATELVQAGKLVPRLSPEHYTLAEAEAAHARLREGGRQGKIVVDVLT